MKKYLYLLFITFFGFMPFVLASCGDDDDNQNGNNGNIEINGVSYPLSNLITMEGSWNEDGDNKGTFTVTVLDKANDALYYSFSFISSEQVKEGDSFSTTLTLEPLDGDDGENDFLWNGPFNYVSGTAKVIKTDKAKSILVIQFDNLTMKGKETSYTFKGTAEVSYRF